MKFYTLFITNSSSELEILPEVLAELHKTRQPGLIRRYQSLLLNSLECGRTTRGIGSSNKTTQCYNSEINENQNFTNFNLTRFLKTKKGT